MKKATVKEIKRATTQNVRSNLESVCIVRDSPWIENEDEYSSDFSINLFFDLSSAETKEGHHIDWISPVKKLMIFF